MGNSLKPTQTVTLGSLLVVAVFALCWNGFILFTLLAGEEEGIFNLCFLPFIAVGLAMIALTAWMTLTLVGKAMNLAPAEVALPLEPVMAGALIPFTFRQQFRRPVQLESAVIDLLQRESATYTRGTDTTTVTNDTIVEHREQVGGRYAAGAALTDTKPLPLPHDAMHTFVAKKNSIKWFVRVKIKVAGWPEIETLYEVPVAAQRAG